MKTKPNKFVLKGKEIEYVAVAYESIKEAVTVLGEAEALKVLNFAQDYYAKTIASGKNPTRQRKRFYKLDSTKIDDALIQKLKDAKALLL